MRHRAAALWAAYVLLVVAVVWSTWSIGRAVDRLEVDVCVAAEYNVAGTLAILAVFGEQDGVDPDRLAAVRDIYADRLDELQDRCGTIVVG